MHLPAQHVEEVGRRRGVDDLEVGAGAGGEQALGPAGGVVGSAAVDAVRQQDDEARRAQPAVLAAGDALVEHRLRDVEEFAELRLPDHQAVRVGQADAVLEAQHGVLDQRRVVDLGRCAARGCRAGEDEMARAGGLVMQLEMALGEGAAHAVLAAEADGRAFGQQRGERQGLGRRPGDAFAGLDRGAALVEEARHLGIDGHALRDGGQGAAQLAQRVARQGRSR